MSTKRRPTKAVHNPPKMQSIKTCTCTPDSQYQCGQHGWLPAKKVVIGWLHPGEVKGDFMRSVLDLMVWDFHNKQYIINGGGFIDNTCGCLVAAGRNKLVEMFLAYGQADWLLMLDSDMTFEPNLLDQLMSAANANAQPIIGGLCFGFTHDGSGVRPMLFDLAVTEDGIPTWVQLTEIRSGCIRVAGTGAACLLVHKSVFERIANYENEARPGKKGFDEAYPWFQEASFGGQPMGEDMTFCYRAGIAGIPVAVNTAVRLGHVKTANLNLDAYLVQQARLKAQLGVAESSSSTTDYVQEAQKEGETE